MQRRASIRCGAVERLGRAGVEAARGSVPQCCPSSAGASGSSSRLVRITPRNSQLPCSRLNEIGVLALPADAGRLGERLFHHRRGVDEHLELARRPLDDEPRERLQRLLDRLVIVAALGIDRDPPDLGRGRRAPAGRSPAHSSSPARSPISPRATAPAADARWSARLLHPAHRPVMARLEPAPEVEPRRVRRVGAREAAGGEAEPLGFGPYCFLKAFVGSHGGCH